MSDERGPRTTRVPVGGRTESGAARRIAAVVDLDGIDFDKGDGLVPVVAQDAASGAVLMLAYADRAALEASIDTGELHFWSRTRKHLWRKGDTSGNVMELESLYTDCDGDSVLALVQPRGPACHTATPSCFGEVPAPGSEGARSKAASGGSHDILARLDRTLAERARTRPEGSYTTRLLADRNLRIKKLGEETAELICALATGGHKQATAEAADLVYHALVALRAEGIGLQDVCAMLEKREGGENGPEPGGERMRQSVVHPGQGR